MNAGETHLAIVVPDGKPLFKRDIVHRADRDTGSTGIAILCYRKIPVAGSKFFSEKGIHETVEIRNHRIAFGMPAGGTTGNIQCNCVYILICCCKNFLHFLLGCDVKENDPV